MSGKSHPWGLPPWTVDFHPAPVSFPDRVDIAIVGGGATGVELAAELSRMVELAAGYGESDIRRRLRLTPAPLRPLFFPMTGRLNRNRCAIF